MKTNTIRLLLVAITAAVVALTAVAVVLLTRVDDIDLADDPRGQEACDALVTMIEYEGDVEIKTGAMLEAGKAAQKARSKEIRDTATSLAEGIEGAEALNEFATVDVDALTKACEDAGIEIPD